MLLLLIQYAFPSLAGTLESPQSTRCLRCTSLRSCLLKASYFFPFLGRPGRSRKMLQLGVQEP